MGRQKHALEVGTKYNRLTILEETTPKVYEYEKYKTTIRRVKVMCDCGNTTTVNINQLKNSSVMSCGCLKSEQLKHKHNEYRKRKNQAK